jgi:hypothetical protein
MARARSTRLRKDGDGDCHDGAAARRRSGGGCSDVIDVLAEALVVLLARSDTSDERALPSTPSSA